MSHELEAGPPVLSATPIVPEQWSRTNGEWMNCRAEIMDEARQRQFSRARATTDRRIGFQYQHGISRAGESNGGRQPIRSGPNDDSVILNRHVEGNRKSRSIVQVRCDGMQWRRARL